MIFKDIDEIGALGARLRSEENIQHYFIMAKKPPCECIVVESRKLYELLRNASVAIDAEPVRHGHYYDIRNELAKSFIDNIDSWIDVHNGRLKMFEKKYKILDEAGKELATGMSIEMANAFIRWYNCEFFREHPRLTIEEAANQEEPGQLDYSDVYG